MNQESRIKGFMFHAFVFYWLFSFVSVWAQGREKLPNPLGEGTTVFTLIGTSIQAFLGIVGIIALAVFIYAGITWLTSAGNPDKIKKGKDAMVWTAISLAIIFSSYALVTFVISGFVK